MSSSAATSRSSAASSEIVERLPLPRFERHDRLRPLERQVHRLAGRRMSRPPALCSCCAHAERCRRQLQCLRFRSGTYLGLVVDQPERAVGQQVDAIDLGAQPDRRASRRLRRRNVNAPSSSYSIRRRSIDARRARLPSRARDRRCRNRPRSRTAARVRARLRPGGSERSAGLAQLRTALRASGTSFGA